MKKFFYLPYLKVPNISVFPNFKHLFQVMIVNLVALFSIYNYYYPNQLVKIDQIILFPSNHRNKYQTQDFIFPYHLYLDIKFL